MAPTPVSGAVRSAPKQGDGARLYREVRHYQGPRVYRCAACGAELFRSEAKYDSGTGWPSFFEPIARGAVELHEDRSFGMRRTEVTCARCDSHLGHLFDDGPGPTGERYCMNSISLDLEPGDEAEDVSAD